MSRVSRETIASGRAGRGLFHVKQGARLTVSGPSATMHAMFRARSLLPVAAAAALLAAACVGDGFTQPRGWAEPVFEGRALHLFPETGLLAAVRLDQPGGLFGDAAWTFPDDNLAPEEDIDLGAVYGPPIVTADRIVLATFDGELIALSRGGRFLPGEGWMRDDVEGSIVGGAVLAGDRLIFGTTERRLYARSPANGGPVGGDWPLEGKRLDGEIWARPVVSGGAVFVATMDGTVHAFDAESGERRWAEPFDAGGAIAEMALIDGSGTEFPELLFVPTLGSRVWLIDPVSGRAAHQPLAAGAWVWTTPAVADGIAWFGDFGGVVRALRLADGQVLWTYDTESKVKARPVRIGDTLIVGDEKGYVHFLDAATGALRNRNPQSGGGLGKFRASFVERDGFAWMLSTNGRLYRADAEALSVNEVGLRGLP